MPRKPRVQFPGAIYHIVTRGDGRRELFHDQEHDGRLTRGLADEVKRSGWKVLAFCWMPNHIHLLLTTPDPNLSSGMQHWLSGYANWYAKRNRRTGHLFQGRYKSFLVEDNSYYWSLSRYIHLNPCVGKRPLCDKPDAWQHSSYVGYARNQERLDFVDYAALLRAWTGEFGGRSAAASYRRFVSEGLHGRLPNPLKAALDEWVIGSRAFLKRMVQLAERKIRQNKADSRGVLRRIPSQRLWNLLPTSSKLTVRNTLGSAVRRPVATWRRWFVVGSRRVP